MKLAEADGYGVAEVVFESYGDSKVGFEGYGAVGSTEATAVKPRPLKSKTNKQRRPRGPLARPKPTAALKLRPYRPEAVEQRGYEGRGVG